MNEALTVIPIVVSGFILSGNVETEKTFAIISEVLTTQIQIVSITIKNLSVQTSSYLGLTKDLKLVANILKFVIEGLDIQTTGQVFLVA